MINTLKSLLGFGVKEDYSALIKEGAVIVDVRTPQEFLTGHIKNSVNIPVESIKNSLAKLPNKNKTIITCCASGMRSSVAKNILLANGYTKVFNGGGWTSLNNKIFNN
jgi:rhodanese-related sulfurtransferase